MDTGKKGKIPLICDTNYRIYFAHNTVILSETGVTMSLATLLFTFSTSFFVLSVVRFTGSM
jgi:hypothetical protein